MDTSIFFDAAGVFDSSPRTILRRFDGKYKKDYLSLRTDWEGVSEKINKQISDYKEVLWEQVMARESDVLYLIITDANDSFIGYATIGNLDGDIPSIGLEIKDGYRHKGHGKKTVEMMLGKAEFLLEKKRFLVEIYSDNEDSYALFKRYMLEEIGKKESEYIQAINELNSIADGKIDFSIVDKKRYEFESRRKIIQYHLLIRHVDK